MDRDEPRTRSWSENTRALPRVVGFRRPLPELTSRSFGWTSNYLWKKCACTVALLVDVHACVVLVGWLII